ncbi:MAG TPA: hypothetical protein DCO79_02500 [Spirochaeta sp.]|nr:hypothetical protein [Spirochaeta sp.]
MKKIKLISILVIIAVVMMSCTTASFSGLQMTKDLASFDVVKDFETEITVWEFLGVSGGANLGNISADNMDGPVFDAVQTEIQKLGGDAAVNITIVQKASIGNMLINGLSATLLAPCKVSISGTIVKFDN